MEKKLSCGILLCSEHGFLALLPSRRKAQPGFYDIAKGCKEPYDKLNKTTAIRELKEETSLDYDYIKQFTNAKLHDFGVMEYLPEKDLALFVLEVENIDKFFSFNCTSFFEDYKTGIEMPEMVGYKWVRDLSYYFKSLQKAFANLRSTNPEFNTLIEKYENK